MLKLFAFAQSWAMDAAESLKKREEGQTMAEYGLLIALIAVVLITVIGLVGTSLTTKFQEVVNAL